ncbi:aureolysin, fungalysin/thermolysin metalloproteinase precursor [Staphylococcus aureus]|nr:aureolysin, fungalysin/thermolysin metalloproteinase precursor [Staphylococcus aureus]GBY36000.1 aureolysin, fungalysin/thermolysin metalloproteinase precursor [Staphylococcus aureus]
MRKFSRYAFTSMAAVTLLSTLSPAALAIDSNNKPANSDIKFEVTQKSDAVKALKELPKSENVKNIYQDYAVTDVKLIKRDLRITHCNRVLMVFMHLTKK